MENVLLDVIIRQIGLAAAAAVGLQVVRSAAVRHAVWTVVTAGMPVMAFAVAMLPVIPLRVLAPAPRVVIEVAALPTSPGPAVLPAATSTRKFPWELVYGAGLAAMTARLVYGYGIARKLVRASRAIPRFDGAFESAQVSVPVTVGWLRPAILLPAGWTDWEEAKLHAVLVHERNHIRRGDWVIAMLAGVNRCVFWFHPLAWWLEARLRVLAEEACDDASLAQVASREYYAQVLVEMASAVRSGTGRAIAMAKGGDVGMRVERILDEQRSIGSAMTKRQWAAMVLCAVPLVYLGAVARPARVQAQEVRVEAPVQATVEQSAAHTEIPRARQSRSSRPQADESQPSPEELERIDGEIAKFKRENMGRLPEQFQANVSQLNSLQMMLAQVNESLSGLQRERLMVETQIQNLNGQIHFQPAPDPSSQQAMEERIRELQGELSAMRETLSPNHPSVKRLQAQIETAERARAAIGSYADSQSQQRKLDLEGQLNLMKTQLQNLNLQMDEQVKKQMEIQRQIAAYQSRVESSPQLEGQYMELQRQRQALLERSAKQTVKIEVHFGPDGKPQHMRVIDGLGPREDEQALQTAKSLRFVSPGATGQQGPRVVTVEVPIPVK